MEIPYFIFGLNQHLCAIQSIYVAEVFALPELILIPDAPLGIVGVIDLRGDVLPVIDLRFNAEGQPRQYQIADSILVVKQADLRIGIIVNSVDGMKEILPHAITTELSEHQDWINSDAKKLFVGRVVNEENISILGEPKDWFNPVEIQQVISVTSFLVHEIHHHALADNLQTEARWSEKAPSIAETPFCPTATLEEQIIFRQRAEHLRKSVDEHQSSEGTKPLVVIVLNDKLFGIDAQIVREFITIRQATPIPCCPKYIIGNTNLRGEILTIVDIGQSLNLSLTNLSRTPKAIVIEFEDTLVGLVVEEIHDAAFSINPRDIKAISDPVFAVKREYFHGSISYHDQMIHILDLPTLLLSDELVVNEIF
ncbi:MAG: chemotaxis protein CheW [Cyanothece sp. SIO1E1]|nr:chemotaxis protein CheW [Cyanothece sp. SIO1E1]